MKQVGARDVQDQLLRLGTLLQLARRARQAANRAELGFVMVNETHSLVPYRQAVLWRGDASRGSVVALSGSPGVERNAPYVQWLRLVYRDAVRAGAPAAPKPIGAGDLGAAIGRDWSEWLPPSGLLLGFPDGSGRLVLVLLARETPWGEADQHLLAELADGYAHAWRALDGRTRRRIGRLAWRGSGWLKLVVAAALAACLLLPVRLTALAPAEIVPLHPTIVRAPLEGVVDRIDVAPNAAVAKGDPLLALDPRVLDNQLDVATKTLSVAEAEYRAAAQQALFDDKSRAQLAVLKIKMDQRRAELDYVRSLLDRIKVTATRAGVAIYSDPDDWAGRPVALGERIMQIADPARAEIEVWLPATDAITLQPGAEVDMFLNVSPDAPIRAHLREASYDLEQSPEGVFGYRLKAELDEPAAPPASDCAAPPSSTATR